MNTRFSISIILTIGALVLTLFLCVVIVIAHDRINPEQGVACGTTSSVVIPKEAALNHPGEKIFNENCKACHRIDRQLVGPALAGALERYDSLWLVDWIRNSSKMIADGDPMAVALFNEYNQFQMTPFTSLKDEELRQLLEYLKLASEPVAVPMPAPNKVEI